MSELAPLEQSFLMRIVLPEINRTGNRFKKYRAVLARAAIPGEKIVTFTSRGEESEQKTEKETENTASENDYVVKNRTSASEQYVVSKLTFEARYSFHKKVDDTWSEYLPLGEIMAIVVDSRLLELLQRSSPFQIDVNWGSTQIVREGDFLATPLPDMKHVYRIDQLAFSQTYEKSS